MIETDFKSSTSPRMVDRALISLLTQAGQRREVAVAVLFGVGAALSAVALTGTSAYLISRASQQPPVLYLMVAIVSVRALGVARGVFRYLERLTSHDVALRVMTDVRVSTFSAVTSAARRLRRSGQHSADVAARLGADVESLVDLWVRVAIPMVSTALVALLTCVFLFVTAPMIAAVTAVALLVVTIAVPWLTAMLARSAAQRTAYTRGEVAAGVVDAVESAAELTVYGVSRDFVDEFSVSNADLERDERSAALSTGVGSFVTTAVSGLTVCAALILGGQAVAAGDLDGVLFAVVVLVPMAVLELAAGLVPAAALLPGLSASARKVSELHEAARPDTPAWSDPDTAYATAAGSATASTSAGWGLTVRGLNAYRFDAGARRRVLRDVSFDLPRGANLAVIGHSGSGKTTVLNALIDEVDLDQGGPHGTDQGRDQGTQQGAVTWLSPAPAPMNADQVQPVRPRVILAEQDAHVFDSTIRENLRIGRPDCNEEQLWAALRRASLAEWVGQLPQGLDTFVGQHGAALSAGQRRRLTLARALLAPTAVLLVDEPTEHLEHRLAVAIMVDLLDTADMQSTPVIVATHRPTGLTNVHSVVVLDGGAVAAAGSPQSLAAQDGPFRELMQMQEFDL